MKILAVYDKPNKIGYLAVEEVDGKKVYTIHYLVYNPQWEMYIIEGGLAGKTYKTKLTALNVGLKAQGFKKCEDKEKIKGVYIHVFGAGKASELLEEQGA